MSRLFLVFGHDARRRRQLVQGHFPARNSAPSLWIMEVIMMHLYCDNIILWQQHPVWHDQKEHSNERFNKPDIIRVKSMVMQIEH